MHLWLGARSALLARARPAFLLLLFPFQVLLNCFPNQHTNRSSGFVGKNLQLLQVVFFEPDVCALHVSIYTYLCTRCQSKSTGLLWAAWKRGEHAPGKPYRYFFKLYALNAKTNLKPGATKQELERTIEGHILAQAELMGRYGR